MTNLNNDLEQYISDHSSPLDEVLQELTRVTHLTTYNPRMISGQAQGKLLEFICRMLNPSRILEIGTFTGYSTICMARSISDDALIDTIEVNDELEDTIRKFIGKANIESKVNVHFGDACKIIPTLKSSYDLVYIDGDKREYPEYYDLIFPLVKDGGYILADNVLWNGKVLEENPTDVHTKAILEFNRTVQNDFRVENVLLPLRDGLMFIRKL
ncbi:MAG: O-methyltransferase [Bacteroidales bacterium]